MEALILKLLTDPTFLGLGSGAAAVGAILLFLNREVERLKNKDEKREESLLLHAKQIDQLTSAHGYLEKALNRIGTDYEGSEKNNREFRSRVFEKLDEMKDDLKTDIGQVREKVALLEGRFPPRAR